ncbi:hypothetical protein QMK61_01980 [Fulvimonas sp. R45]|uniref:hypothetical protein n=1 Tax=Fulvimonas sp. R45 TaxID=3045937 RepID=UPI00265EE9A8|nr:hypothetical protein [Fulvimonas sp. R45]MDO1527588.1 hypothetical protein [Fulvimonas sp. R45]
MRELERLLPELAPPPGGLARLQHSLQARRKPLRPLAWCWLPAAAGTCALALLALAWLPGAVRQREQTAALARVLRQAMAPPPGGIQVVHGAALALPSGQADVRIYLVQTTAAGGDHDDR